MKPTLKCNPSPNSRSPIYNFMDLDITRSYTPLKINKQKTQAVNGECFKYSKKGYI